MGGGPTREPEVTLRRRGSAFAGGAGGGSDSPDSAVCASSRTIEIDLDDGVVANREMRIAIGPVRPLVVTSAGARIGVVSRHDSPGIEQCLMLGYRFEGAVVASGSGPESVRATVRGSNVQH